MSAPDQIYLQGAADAPDCEAVESGITWCWHQIDDDDVEYVRADLAARATPADHSQTPIPGSPGYALQGLYKMADKYFIDGKPCTPDEYITWQSGIIEAITKSKVPDPKYYGGSAEEGGQHDVKCAYVDGWNDCRGSVLAIHEATPADHSASVAEPESHRILAALIDIYDDGNNNAPEDRCYVEGAWRETIDEARVYLATPADPNVIDYPEAYREMQAAYFAAVDEIRALKSQQDAAIESQRSGEGS